MHPRSGADPDRKVRGAISVIFGSQVLIRILFSELYKIMVNKVISLVLGGAIAPIPPLGSAHAPGSENLWPNRSNGQNKTLCRVIL